MYILITLLRGSSLQMDRVEGLLFSMVFSKVINVNCVYKWYAQFSGTDVTGAALQLGKCVESNLCEFVSVSSVFVEGPLYKKNMLSENFFIQL